MGVGFTHPTYLCDRYGHRRVGGAKARCQHGSLSACANGSLKSLQGRGVIVCPTGLSSDGRGAVHLMRERAKVLCEPKLTATRLRYSVDGMFNFGNDNIALLKELIAHLEDGGVDMDVAKRFARAGEWGLAFREIHSASNADDGVLYKQHQVSMERLNNLLASNSYYAEHLGFPL